MRQHTAPLIVAADGASAALTSVMPGQHGWPEATIQDLVHRHPECLPIREIDPAFADPVPICTELNTPVGAIDNLLVTPTGLPVLVECKLWSNPEARRKVVAQILDYAKELVRWTAADLQREASKRLGETGNPLLARVRAAGHDVDEIDFNDALTRNLRIGRCLLLLVGEGIRESVEAIAEYLSDHAGLHFALGLVEMPIYDLPGGGRLVTPRVLVRTHVIRREVIALPESLTLRDADADAAEAMEESDEPTGRVAFWKAFVRGLRLDDPEQSAPRPGRQGYVTVTLPVPGGNCWLTVYRNESRSEVGVYLSYARAGIGERVVARLLEDWDAIREQLGGTPRIDVEKDGRRLVIDHLRTGPWTSPDEMTRALSWLRVRTNDFVNALRPRVKAAMADLSGEP